MKNFILTLIIFSIPASIYPKSSIKELKATACTCNITIVGEYLTCFNIYSDGEVEIYFDGQMVDHCMDKKTFQEDLFESKKEKYKEKEEKTKKEISNAICSCNDTIVGVFLNCIVNIKNSKGKTKDNEKNIFANKDLKTQSYESCSETADMLNENLNI